MNENLIIIDEDLEGDEKINFILNNIESEDRELDYQILNSFLDNIIGISGGHTFKLNSILYAIADMTEDILPNNIIPLNYRLIYPNKYIVIQKISHDPRKRIRAASVDFRNEIRNRKINKVFNEKYYN